MAKISVYLNSHASQGLNSYSEEELKKFFFRHELEVKRPNSLDELHLSLENEMDQGTEYIFAAGGDGTMNAVSQRLINKNIKLMILPAGTANDFAQELGVTNNLKKITQIFNAQTTKKIDGWNCLGSWLFITNPLF